MLTKMFTAEVKTMKVMDIFFTIEDSHSEPHDAEPWSLALWYFYKACSERLE